MPTQTAGTLLKSKMAKCEAHSEKRIEIRLMNATQAEAIFHFNPKGLRLILHMNGNKKFASTLKVQAALFVLFLHKISS